MTKEPRRHPDGTPYSMDDYEKELAEKEEENAQLKEMPTVLTVRSIEKCGA